MANYQYMMSADDVAKELDCSSPMLTSWLRQ